MLSGIGQGRSLPCASSCTGLPAISGALTVETTGNLFCPWPASVESKNKTSTASRQPFKMHGPPLVACVIFHHQNCSHQDYGRTHDGQNVQSFTEQRGRQKHSENGNQVQRGGCGGDVKMLQCFEEQQHRSTVHKQGEESKGDPAMPVEQPKDAKRKRFHPNQQRQTCQRCRDVAED